MLLIVLMGLIAKLTSVSGDCVVGTQHVNIDWNKISGDQLWYVRLHSPNSIVSFVKCIILKYARPEGNISPITVWAYEISTQSPITVSGYATNWNSTSWEEIFPQNEFSSGRSYPVAVDYDRFLIYKYCFSKSNEMMVHVAYRKPFPEEETVNLVKKKLEENNIEYSQLVDLPMTNCK